MSLFTKIHYFVVVECQVHKIRGLFFKAILRQDIGWYDTHQTGDFAAKMAEWANLALLLFLKNFYMLSTCSESFFLKLQRFEQTPGRYWRENRNVYFLCHYFHRQFGQCLLSRMGTHFGYSSCYASFDDSYSNYCR